MTSMNSIPCCTQQLNGEGLKIGIVMSRFNQPICEQLLHAAVGELYRLGVVNISIVTVPGALEVPLTLQTLAQSDKTCFDALIALGAVIRGETYHFEVVSNDACGGVMDTQLETGIPIANGILTCDTDEQAIARAKQKGADCAQTAVEMARLIAKIQTDPI